MLCRSAFNQVGPTILKDSSFPMSMHALRQLLATAACFLMLSACSSSPDKVECQGFKTGHFLLRQDAPDFHYAAFIDRTNDVQTETDQITGDVSTLAVKWVDDCHYELRLISSTKPYPDSIQYMRKTVPLRTEIVDGTSRYYVFQAQRRPTDPVMRDTMWVRQ
jgi:hypothetical protein